MQEQILAVQRMQDYIDAHLDQPISLAQLASASLFSPWHAHRLFKQFTGLAPADYIRRLRLSRSALKLRDEGVSVTEVAFSLGFGSVDGYQRAFYREFGRNPRDYARHPAPLYLFTSYGVKYRALRKEKQDMSEIKTVFVQEVQKPARRVILKRGVKAEDYFAYCEEVGCDVWGLLSSMKSISGEPVGMWLPDKYMLPGTSRYVQGVELPQDDGQPLPQGFDSIHLPAARYLMFRGEPFREEDYCQAIEEVRQAIDRYDPAPLGCRWDGDNPRIQLEPVGTRGYIELVPIC